MDYNTGKLKTGDSLFQVWFEQIILKLHVPTILALIDELLICPTLFLPTPVQC